MVLWRFKDCSKCAGDLVSDEDMWRCFQCGHYYYPNLLQPVEHPPEPNPPSPQGNGRRRRASWGGNAGRNINSLIEANNVRDERWWERNRRIIAYLEEGCSVREIAALATRSKRAVRGVAERLADLRANNQG